MKTPTYDEVRWDEAIAIMDECREDLNNERVDAAEAKAAAAHALLLEVVGADHPDLGAATALLGSVAWARGRAAESEARLRDALAIFDAYLDDPEDAALVRPLRISALRRLGLVLSQRGEYAAAAESHRSAIAEAEILHGPGALALAELHEALGVCHRFRGDYDAARASYTDAMNLTLAHGQPLTPTHHHNLAGLLCAEGRFADAEPHARQAIALRRADSDSGASAAVSYLGTDLCGLGDALAGQGRYAEAEAAYREGIACYRQAHCEDHLEMAYALHNLADTLVELERHAEAESAYLASIDRKLAAFGHANHEVAASLNNLAALCARRDRLHEARDHSRRALVAVAALPGDHPIREAVHALADELGAA